MVIIKGEINHQFFSCQKNVSHPPTLAVIFPKYFDQFTFLSLLTKGNFGSDDHCEKYCFVVADAFVGVSGSSAGTGKI
jgi:hypothetical protein